MFGLSLALGAFVAGLIVSESELSHQAAGEITPFRDLFAVLFFVSVGMLLDPAAMVADWPALLALLAVATVGKAAVSAGLGRLLGLPLRSALLLGATIAQVGEFSFLLAEQALSLDLLDTRGYNLVLGTAVASIVLTPVLVSGAVRLIERLEHAQLAAEPPVEAMGGFSRGELAAAGEDGGADRPAVVVLGAGRVGRVVVRAVRSRGFRCVVIDRDPRRAGGGRGDGRGDTVRRCGERRDPAPGRPRRRAAARHHDRRRDDGSARGGAGARDQPAADRDRAGTRADRDDRPPGPRRHAARGSRRSRPRSSSRARPSPGWASRVRSRRR